MISVSSKKPRHLAQSLAHPLSLSLSLTHTHTHTLSAACSLFLLRTHTLLHAYSHRLTLSVSFSKKLSILTHSLYYVLSLTHHLSHFTPFYSLSLSLDSESCEMLLSSCRLMTTSHLLVVSCQLITSINLELHIRGYNAHSCAYISKIFYWLKWAVDLRRFSLKD